MILDTFTYRYSKIMLLISVFLCFLGSCFAKDILSINSGFVDTTSISKKEFGINEVEVNSKHRLANITSGSSGIHIDINQLTQLPKFAGESDPYKALQYMGGVSQAGEANSGLYVRGGSNDQNLVLLNGTLIQNPTHVMGLFSVFNPDLIGQMRFFKSDIPAEYGGRLSSIIEISSRNIVPESSKVDGSIGLISSRLSVQTPLSSKFAIYGSFRGSYIGSVILPSLSALGVNELLTENKYDFWDANSGFSYQISNRTKLNAHLYTGIDALKIGSFSDNNLNRNTTSWGNRAAGTQLNHIFNESWSMNHQLNYSRFKIESTFQWYSSYQMLQSQFENINYKADFFHMVDNHQIKFGTEIAYNKAFPNQVNSDSLSPLEISNQINQIHSVQGVLYLRDEWSCKNWQFNVGLRSNLYAHVGPYNDYNKEGDFIYTDNKLIKTFPITLEPRFYSRYLINQVSSVKLAATRHYQYLHQIPVVPFGVPVDIQIPASLYVQPQSSWHFSGGYFRNFLNNEWELSVEGYYKTLENQLEFKNGIEATFTNQMVDKSVLVGKGWSYGSEWKLGKSIGPFTGWISYNLAWSFRQFDQINSGLPFLARNDRRHDLSIVGMFKINERWSCSAIFVYATGNRMNLPVGWFVIDNKVIMEYGKYNAFEMPAYHRLDLAANYKLKNWRGIKSELNFSIYNAYNRANPYQVYLTTNSYKSGSYQIDMSYLLPILPSVSWTFHF